MISWREASVVGETILVVEDEGIIALNLQRILTRFGFRVPETVETGQDALRVVEENPPDLVLMDIQLRGEIDGIEAARRIRSRYDLPIVYLTAFAEDVRLVQARQTEPYGYLIKPVQDRELRAAIEMALFKHRMDQQLRESESRYRELYHSTPTMFHTTTSDGRILQVSDFWLASLGYTREEVIGCQLEMFIAPEFHAYLAEQVFPELLRSGVVRDAECRFLRKDGSQVDVFFSTVAIYDEQGGMASAHSALVDISARKRAETAERDQRALAEALRDTAAALSSTLSFEEVIERVLTNVGRVVPHDAVNIMLVEDGVARLVRSHGFAEQGRAGPSTAERWEVSENPILRLMSGRGDSVVLADTTRQPEMFAGWIHSYVGVPVMVKGHLVGFINLYSQHAGFFSGEHASRLRAFADQAAIAIENAHLYAEVERLATMDELTGIANRRKLFEMGQREFDRARRYGTPLAAILLDIDRFKKVNDTYGHNAGDRVLARIAATISGNVREVDLFGRYGGEEFVLLLPHSSQDSAAEVAERLRRLVEELRFETDRGVMSVTISLGIAMLTPDIPSLATLIDRADQAMYAAKQAGRNRVEIYL
jgi:diguanylate cyclase (GGDEF)-like protein/PAS domain S-box-containing protein